LRKNECLVDKKENVGLRKREHHLMKEKKIIGERRGKERCDTSKMR